MQAPKSLLHILVFTMYNYTGYITYKVCIPVFFKAITSLQSFRNQWVLGSYTFKVYILIFCMSKAIIVIIVPDGVD